MDVITEASTAPTGRSARAGAAFTRPRVPAELRPENWQEDAACASRRTPATFFTPEGMRAEARAKLVRRAKEVCARCPVVQQCRQYALVAGEPYGVWGGLSEEDRREVRAQRKRSAGKARRRAEELARTAS